MSPAASIAFSVTLANPLLLWLACLGDITALAAGMLGVLAVLQHMLVTFGVVEPGDGPRDQRIDRATVRRRGKPAEITALTGIRAVAAWWVVASHLRHDLLMYFPSARGLWKCLGGGHLGVDLFFILSGFIISYSYARSFGTFDGKQYARFLWLRLARIYPVHVLTLLAMAGLVFALVALGRPYGDPERFTLESFARHLFLVNAWIYPLTEKTWNIPSWSVSSEWLAYLAFPAFLLATSWIKSRALALGLAVSSLALVGLSCSLLPYPGTMVYALIRLPAEFLAGCLLFKLYDTSWASSLRWGTAASTALLIAILGSALSPMWGIHGLFWATPLLAVVTYGLSWNEGALARWLSRRSVQHSGRSSYSLYMTHGVVLFAMRYFFYAPELAQSSVVLRIGLLCWYVATVAAVAEVTYAYVEEPARRWMAARFVDRPETAARPVLTAPC